MGTAVIIALTVTAFASPIESDSDYLFADRGQAQVSVATGTPFVGIAEVAVGVTDNFTVGVIGGLTPIFAGAGIRPRGRVAVGKNTHVIVESPILYYPPSETSDEMPWMLAKPMLLVDQKVHNRWHVMTETGLILVTCLDSIANVFQGGDHSEAGHHMDEPENEEFGGVFGTLGGGASFEASERMDVFLRAAVVMDGLAITQSGPIVPIISTLGLTYRI